MKKFTECCLVGIILYSCNPVFSDQPAPPCLQAHAVAAPPVIDGRLTEKCWSQAPVAANFWKVDGSGPVDFSAAGQVAFDAQNLYIGLRCPLKDAESLKAAQALKPDQNQIFGNDTVEVLLDIYPDHSALYHFAVNAANGRFSERNGDDTWRPFWRSATFIGKDFWSVEIAIPLAAFHSGKKMGAEWGLNLTRGASCWAPTFGSFHLVKRFGRLKGLTGNFDDYRWDIDVATGPTAIGDSPITVQLSNQTGSSRQVDLLARVFTRGEDNPPFVVRKNDLYANEVHGAVCAVKVPLTEPRPYKVSLVLTDTKTKKLLALYSTHILGPWAIRTVWDRSFYMSEKQARLTVECGLSGAEGSELKVQVRRSNPAAVVQEKMTVLDKNRQSKVTLDLEPLPVGQYEVMILPAKGTVFKPTPATRPLRKLNPRAGAVQYTDTGVLLRNGTPIFPLGFYYIYKYLNGPFLQAYAEEGFNTHVLEWSNGAGYTNALKSQNPFGVVPLVGIQNSAELQAYKYTGPETFPLWIKAARKLVREVSEGAGENVLAWCTWDEPPLGIWYDLTKKLHEVVRELDPYHPTMTVNFKPGVFRAFADATDILAPDAYPSFPGGRIRKVSEYVDAAVAAVDGRQPVLAVLQTFSEAGGCMPTPAELRAMIYLSIIHGAKGIIFFSYDYRVGPMADKNPVTWKALLQAANEIKMLAPTILSTSISKAAVIIAPGHGLDYRLFNRDGSYVLVVVNPDNKTVNHVKLSIHPDPSLPNSGTEVLFENRTVPMSKGEWKDHFKPFETHIYKIKSDHDLD